MARSRHAIRLTGFTVPVSPVSPVRTRSACSRSSMKILPSPILPVRPPSVMAGTTSSTRLSGTATSSFSLGRKEMCVFRAAIDFGMAFLAAIAAHFGHRHAGHGDGGERLAHRIQAMRLDDRDDEFHEQLLSAGCLLG